MKIIEKRADGSVRVYIKNDKPSRTQQQFKEQVNINNIMRKFKLTGDMSIFTKTGKGTYGDFTDVKDYHTALDKVLDANQSFQNLPAIVRSRFENDPGKLLAFINDKRNYSEAVKLGLIEAKPTPQAQTTNTPQAPTHTIQKTKKTPVEDEE